MVYTMATEVLLLADVEKLGQAGEVVKVADGYARNYLLPKDLAAPVSKEALRRLEKLRKEREELLRVQKAGAQEQAGKLNGSSITIRARTTDGTALYGSVQVADVVEAIGSDLKVDLDKSQVQIDEPFRETGTFDIEIKLHPEVTATVKLWIVEE